MADVSVTYQEMESVTQQLTGHAAETEQVGDTAYAENAGRNLEDSAKSGRWPVVTVVKAVVY